MDNKTRINILNEIDKDRFRKKLTRFSWQAYNIIPQINCPDILDIGCGSGSHAIDIAVLSKGIITGVDIDANALKIFKNKVNALRLNRHIKIVKGSIDKLRFKKNRFDIIWSEGSISFIGFEKGLKEWQKYIKPGGYMVIHDEIKDHEKKLNKISELNYTIIKHFIVSEHIWLNDYFRPLEKHIKTLKEKYKNNPDIIGVLNDESVEIDKYRESSGDFASVFYILQKN